MTGKSPRLPQSIISEAILVSASPVADIKEDPNAWLPALDLYQRDKDILESSQWLNDGIIYAA